MTFSEVVQSIKNAFSTRGVFARFLPPTLICYTAICRSGISGAMIAAEVINNNREIGIPVGPNPDGSPNLINKHDYGLVNAVTNAFLKNAVVQVGIPAGSLLIQVNGANAGGPIVATGTNLTNTLAYGIFGI